VDFRQAMHVLGAYGYLFWMKGMRPLRRGDGDQYLHRTSDTYRTAIRRKLAAYHVHVQLCCIAQGLLQHLALNHTAEVWRCFRSWLRTMSLSLPPSSSQMHCTRAGIILITRNGPSLTKFWQNYRTPAPDLDTGTSAA